jgi:formate dehydrogenase maturation protein FdhE
MMDKEQYIKTKGLTCPFCGSESIEGGFVEIDTGKALQEIACNQCRSKWQDVYELVDMVPIGRED